MLRAMTELLDRITVEQGKCGGRPCIRGMRFPVRDVLGMLAAGESSASIVSYHPDLEEDDIRACLAYAARLTDTVRPLAA